MKYFAVKLAVNRNNLAATGTSAEFGMRRTVPKSNIVAIPLKPPESAIEMPQKENVKIICYSTLKALEGKTFPTETALFDALKAAGISTLGNYRSGGHNREVARKEAGRYVEYKPTREIDPNCKSKRQCTVIEVYESPKTKVNKSGKSGKYINHLTTNVM